jgi:hypothetical protein
VAKPLPNIKATGGRYNSPDNPPKVHHRYYECEGPYASELSTLCNPINGVRGVFTDEPVTCKTCIKTNRANAGAS